MSLILALLPYLLSNCSNHNYSNGGALDTSCVIFSYKYVFLDLYYFFLDCLAILWGPLKKFALICFVIFFPMVLFESLLITLSILLFDNVYKKAILNVCQCSIQIISRRKISNTLRWRNVSFAILPCTTKTYSVYEWCLTLLVVDKLD